MDFRVNNKTHQHHQVLPFAQYLPVNFVQVTILQTIFSSHILLFGCYDSTMCIDNRFYAKKQKTIRRLVSADCFTGILQQPIGHRLSYGGATGGGGLLCLGGLGHRGGKPLYLFTVSTRIGSRHLQNHRRDGGKVCLFFVGR